MEKVILDRFEGILAVCIRCDKSVLEIDRSLLPIKAKEGDTLLLDGEHILIDEADTLLRAERIKKRMEQLWTK